MIETEQGKKKGMCQYVCVRSRRHGVSKRQKRGKGSRQSEEQKKECVSMCVCVYVTQARRVKETEARGKFETERKRLNEALKMTEDISSKVRTLAVK